MSVDRVNIVITILSLYTDNDERILSLRERIFAKNDATSLYSALVNYTIEKVIQQKQKTPEELAKLLSRITCLAFRLQRKVTDEDVFKKEAAHLLDMKTLLPIPVGGRRKKSNANELNGQLDEEAMEIAGKYANNMVAVTEKLKMVLHRHPLTDADTVIRMCTKYFQHMVRTMVRESPYRATLPGAEADNLMHPGEIFYDAEACEEELQHYLRVQFHHHAGKKSKQGKDHLSLALYKYLIDHPGLFTFVAFLYKTLIPYIDHGKLAEKLVGPLNKADATTQFTYSEYGPAVVHSFGSIVNRELLKTFYSQYSEELSSLPRAPERVLAFRKNARHETLQEALNYFSLFGTLKDFLRMPSHLFTLLSVDHINGYFDWKCYEKENHGAKRYEREVTERHPRHYKQDYLEGEDGGESIKPDALRKNIRNARTILITFRQAYGRLKSSKYFESVMDSFFGEHREQQRYSRQDLRAIYFDIIGGIGSGYHALESERTSFYDLMCDFVFLFVRQLEYIEETPITMHRHLDDIQKGVTTENRHDIAHFDKSLAISVSAFPEYQLKPRRLVLPKHTVVPIVTELSSFHRRHLGALRIALEYHDEIGRQLVTFYGESVESCNRIMARQPRLYSYVEQVVYKNLAERVWQHTVNLFKGYIGMTNEDCFLLSVENMHIIMMVWAQFFGQGLGATLPLFPSISLGRMASNFKSGGGGGGEQRKLKVSDVTEAYLLAVIETARLVILASLNPSGLSGEGFHKRNVIHDLLEEVCFSVNGTFAGQQREITHVLRSLLYYQVAMYKEAQSYNDWLFMNVNHRDVFFYARAGGGTEDIFEGHQCTQRVVIELLESHRKAFRVRFDPKNRSLAYTAIMERHGVAFRRSRIDYHTSGSVSLDYTTQALDPGNMSHYAFGKEEVANANKDSTHSMNVGLLKEILRVAQPGLPCLLILRIKPGPVSASTETARKLAAGSRGAHTKEYSVLRAFLENSYLILNTTTKYDAIPIGGPVLTDFERQLYVIHVFPKQASFFTPVQYTGYTDVEVETLAPNANDVLLWVEKMDEPRVEIVKGTLPLHNLGEGVDLITLFARMSSVWGSPAYAGYEIIGVWHIGIEGEPTKRFHVLLRQRDRFTLDIDHFDYLCKVVMQIKSPVVAVMKKPDTKEKKKEPISKKADILFSETKEKVMLSLSDAQYKEIKRLYWTSRSDYLKEHRGDMPPSDNFTAEILLLYFGQVADPARQLNGIEAVNASGVNTSKLTPLQVEYFSKSYEHQNLTRLINELETNNGNLLRIVMQNGMGGNEVDALRAQVQQATDAAIEAKKGMLQGFIKKLVEGFLHKDVYFSNAMNQNRRMVVLLSRELLIYKFAYKYFGENSDVMGVVRELGERFDELTPSLRGRIIRSHSDEFNAASNEEERHYNLVTYLDDTGEKDKELAQELFHDHMEKYKEEARLYEKELREFDARTENNSPTLKRLLTLLCSYYGPSGAEGGIYYKSMMDYTLKQLRSTKFNIISDPDRMADWTKLIDKKDRERENV